MSSVKTKKTKLAIDSKSKVALKEISDEKKVILDSESNHEKDLLDSIQILLRLNSIERSHASIRDIADITEGAFDFRDAVTALENMEFSANVGKLKASQITQGHCPLIVEFKDKTTYVLKNVDRKKKYEVYDTNKDNKVATYTYLEFR